MKDSAVVSFGNYFKSKKEKLCSKLFSELNLRQFVELLHIFLTTSDKVQKYVKMMQSNSSDNFVSCYNIGF